MNHLRLVLFICMLEFVCAGKACLSAFVRAADRKYLTEIAFKTGLGQGRGNIGKVIAEEEEACHETPTLASGCPTNSILRRASAGR
jgi:hypothetical protein